MAGWPCEGCSLSRCSYFSRTPGAVLWRQEKRLRSVSNVLSSNEQQEREGGEEVLGLVLRQGRLKGGDGAVVTVLQHVWRRHLQLASRRPGRLASGAKICA